MATSIVPPSRTRPIVDKSGSMSQEFTSWTESITDQSLIISTGSPEGVITARQGAQYMDESGSTGSILYIKKLADVSGDTSKGWVLV